MSSIRDKIKATVDLDVEVVEVPEWDVTVEVRSLSARERFHLLRGADAVDGNADVEVLYPQIIVATAYDPASGEKLFTADDVDWLMDKSPAAVDRLALAAMRVSGMMEDSVDRGKDG